MRCPVRARKQVVTFRNCPTVIGAGRHGRCQPRRHHPPGPGYRWRVARHRLFGDEPGLVLRHGFISLRAQRHPDFRRLLQAVGARAGQTQRRSRCSPRRHHVTLRAWTAVEPCCPGYCPPTSPPMMAPEESRPGSTAHPMDPRHASTPTQTSRTTRSAGTGLACSGTTSNPSPTWWQPASGRPCSPSGSLSLHTANDCSSAAQTVSPGRHGKCHDSCPAPPASCGQQCHTNSRARSASPQSRSPSRR